MSRPLPSTTSAARLRLTLLAVALALLWPAPTAQAQTVALGDGLALTVGSGSLDPTTLAGTAEAVTVSIDDQPVATIARLTLTSRGALDDADFAITSFEAHDIAASDGSVRLAEASGRDLPVGTLRALARDMEAVGEPGMAALFDRLGRMRFGTLVLAGLEGEDDIVHMKVARIAAEGGGDGRAERIIIEDGTLIDKEQGVHVRLAAARVDGLSFATRSAEAVEIDGLAISGNMLDVVMAAVRFTGQTGQLDDGTPYAARSTLAVTDLAVKPGLAPDPTLAQFFASLGDAGVTVQVEGQSSAQPQAGNFAMDSELKITAQTGDALDLSARTQIPIATWQLLNETLVREPSAAETDGVMELMASFALVDLEISATAGDLADRLIEAAGRESGLEPQDMRAQFAEEVYGVLGILPAGAAELREAVMAMIARSGTLRLAIKPDNPVPLVALLSAPQQGDILWDMLNVTASHDGP